MFFHCPSSKAHIKSVNYKIRTILSKKRLRTVTKQHFLRIINKRM